MEYLILLGLALIYLIDYKDSDTQELSFGVPQGSVVRTSLYCLYTKPVSYLIRRVSLHLHLYADDTQIHIHWIKDIIGTVAGGRAYKNTEWVYCSGNYS